MSDELPMTNVAAAARRPAALVGWSLIVRRSALVILLACCALRVWQLDRLPGLNGDEAWLGVQAARAAQGESFAWRTPTGNPLNPFYFGPLALLHLALAPSVALLRSVAVASGLAALAVNYALCRGTFDRRTALVSTLLLAAMPMNLAYSRFGWDASQSLLAGVLVTHCSLRIAIGPPRRRRWVIAAAVALAAAWLVHPTNVFLAPLAVAATLARRRAEIRRGLARLAAPDAGPSARLVAWGLLAAACAGLWLARRWTAIAAARLLAPVEALQFVQNYLRLLSGTTVYRYISGAIPLDPLAPPPLLSDLDLSDLAALGLVATALVGFVRLARRERCAADAVLGAGLSAVVVGFFLVAGPGAAGPHFERYAICLVAPTALLLARGAHWWLDQRGASSHLAGATLAVALVAMPAGFARDYLQFLDRTGGRSHLTFRTGATEPKLAAWQLIQAERRPGKPLVVVADQWWNVWPLRYFAATETDVRVAGWGELSGRALSGADTWFVEFAGSAELARVRTRLAERGLASHEHTIVDAAGRPLLVVVRALER